MFGIGPLELGIVLVIALLVLGPKKLPELARGLGKGLSEFRRASNDLRRSLDMDLEPHKIEPPPAPAQTSAPHLPPDVGSALDQAEKETEREAEQKAAVDARPPPMRPEPAPARPEEPPAGGDARHTGAESTEAESAEAESTEAESAEAGGAEATDVNDGGNTSPRPTGGAGSPGD